MDGTAIKIIEELAIDANRVLIDGEVYARDDYSPVKPQHYATLRMSTLKSLADFIAQNPQNLDFANAIIVIDPDFTVRLMGDIIPQTLDRSVYAEVKAYPSKGFEFGNRYDLESFIVALKTKFVHAADWEEVFNVARKVQIDDGVEIDDNGMSQRVTIKKGISAASLSKETIKTDYTLAPNRIFTECEQPASVFFLRLSGNKEMGISISLHETDGGDWRKTAAQNIKECLVQNGVELPIYL